MAGLETILERIAQLGMDCEIWLNGSFTTRKREPDDVDFIIFAPLTFLEGDHPERDEFIEWLNDKNDEPKAVFRCHTQVVFESLDHGFANDLIADTRTHWQRQFGYSVAAQEPKGIVVLDLKQESVEQVGEGGER